MNVVLRYGVPDTNYLDKARVGGKKVIAMPYPFTSDLFKHTKMQGTLTDAQAAEITTVVEAARSHPSLLAYYLVDEPEIVKRRVEVESPRLSVLVEAGILLESTFKNPWLREVEKGQVCLRGHDFCGLIVLDIPVGFLPDEHFRM